MSTEMRISTNRVSLGSKGFRFLTKNGNYDEITKTGRRDENIDF